MRIAKILFLTGFFAGFSPFAPGTIGSIMGIIFYLLFPGGFHSWLLFLVLTYFAIRLSGESYELFLEKDSDRIIIDEILGMWLALLITSSKGFYHILEAFLIFRFLDIYKPFYVDRM
ncbi:MAG: phosphatidylglycerophosphatase A, partial [Thermosulfidibacteraceae bacterium]